MGNIEAQFIGLYCVLCKQSRASFREIFVIANIFILFKIKHYFIFNEIFITLAWMTCHFILQSLDQ